MHFFFGDSFANHFLKKIISNKGSKKYVLTYGRTNNDRILHALLKLIEKSTTLNSINGSPSTLMHSNLEDYKIDGK